MDQATQKLADAIVRDAAHRYFASRRDRVDAFVDRHFTFCGSLALHRCALGWDLIRAPLNLFLAGPSVGLGLAGRAARWGHSYRLASWIARRRLLLETDLAREIEWLVANELLEIHGHRHDRGSYRDALAETILADHRAAERLAAPPGVDDELRGRLAAAIDSYVASRAAMTEIATGLVVAGVGALAVKQATPGLATLSWALAATIAQQAAITAFPLGATLGALWYGWFPVGAGPGLLAAVTAGVAFGCAVLAAFAGIVTDPIQRCLGLHRRRLLWFLQMLESAFDAECSGRSTLCDQYVARLIDLFDLAASAWRVAHA
jgi:hypothetical protein